MAITQPGGAGTTIYLYDDTSATNHAAAPGPHTWAEIATAFAADFVSNSTNLASYRSKVTVQIGDTGTGTASTSIVDTNAVVLFDSAKTLAFRATQTSSWALTLGTKLGSGNTASGVNGGFLAFGAATVLRGTVKLYGCILKQTSGAVTWNPGFASSGSEAVNCLFQSSSTGTAPFVFGATTATLANLYNVDLSHTSTTSFTTTNFFVDNAERLTWGGSTPTSLIASGSNSIQIKDVVLFGSPSVSDLRWTGSTAAAWKLIGPKYTGSGIARFTTATSGVPSLANATVEYWSWDVKVVDSTGAGVQSIPVKITDTIGNVQVNTTTDSNGAVSFGSGLTLNAMAVVDHYSVGTTYTLRHRSPFFVEINTGASANSNYLARRYYFYWPGYETFTTTGGQFQDVADVVSIQDQPGAPTTWTEAVQP